MKRLTYLTILSLITLNLFIQSEDPNTIKYRQEMRDFVIGISDYAEVNKKVDKPFYVIPQNGNELVLTGEKDNGNRKPHIEYLDAIDGNGQESLFYGHNGQQTEKEDTKNRISWLDISKKHGNKILITDYCRSIKKVKDSNQRNFNLGYVSFAANNKDLTKIPKKGKHIYNENKLKIAKLSQVQNFLYLIEPSKFKSKEAFIKKIRDTNYDLLIIDRVFQDTNQPFIQSEVEQLREKENGGKRLVICYMSIGEAETYRYYWKSKWANEKTKPDWLGKENPNWEGNYKVKYWYPEWQSNIYGNENAYLDKILNMGFDGVYLDIVDGFEYYEENQ